MKITPCAIKKTLAITFPADCCIIGSFGALSPGLTLHAIPEYIDESMFLPSSQIDTKFFRIAVKMGKIFGSFKTILWILLIISDVVISFGRPKL